VADSAPNEIACSLNLKELFQRREELLPGLIRQAVETSVLPNGMRLVFETRPGSVESIAHTIELERSCCRFFRFVVTFEPEMGRIIVEITGPEGTRELLRSLTR